MVVCLQPQTGESGSLGWRLEIIIVVVLLYH